MAIERVQLRKLLQLMFSPASRVTSLLKRDIQRDLARERGAEEGGPDFYAPFWADARKHILGLDDLRSMTEKRVEANGKRARLYGILCDGFLLWWNERRRWTNEPINLSAPLSGQFALLSTAMIVRIGSIVHIRDGLHAERAVYPYLFDDPALVDRAAQLGFWALTQAFPSISADEHRILDVIRGRTFALDRTPLRGDEQQEFIARCVELTRQRDSLRDHY